MSRQLIGLGALLIGLPAAQGATLQHAGFLLDQGDHPVDGTVSMSFRLYDSPAGLNPVWSSGPSVCAVGVRGGYFSASLGAGCGPSIPEEVLTSGAPRFMEVSVAGVTLSPRTTVLAVPAAVRAQSAATADLATNAVNAAHAADALEAGRATAADRADTAALADDASRWAGKTPAEHQTTSDARYVRLSPGVAQAGGLQLSGTVEAASLVGNGAGITSISDSALPASVVRMGADGRIPVALLPTAAGGVAILDGTGKIPASMLPASNALVSPSGASPASPATLAPGASVSLASGINSLAIDPTVWISIDNGSTYQPLEYAGRVASSYGDGSDGALTVTSNTTLEAPRFAVSANAGSSSVSLASTTGLAVGNELLFVQMQGSGAGTYETATITAINGTTVSLAAPLTSAYTTSGSNRAQAVRVYQYSSLSVAGGVTLSGPAWDTSTGLGGVLPIRVLGTATITGTLDMTGKGFRGGANFPSGSDYVWGYAGEGELGYGSRTGNTGSSGGGAGCGQAGGGGGGHGLVGSAGVKDGCWQSCGGAAIGDPGAVGPDAGNKLLIGGGGGASGSHSGGGRDGAPGGAGGGGILLSAKSLTVRGAIRATGASGANGYPASSGQPMGGGGGGAGGIVWLQSDALDVAGATLVAAGGAGGANAVSGACSPSGVGGAGGAGRVRLTAAATSGNFAQLSPSSEGSLSIPSTSVRFSVGDISLSQTAASPGVLTLRNSSAYTIKAYAVVHP